MSATSTPATAAPTAGPGVRVATGPSVVVPVGPGDRSWRDLAGDLAAAEIAEVVFAATEPAPPEFADLAARIAAPTRWLVTAAGRGPQQNAGATSVGGEHLLFLHADSHIGPVAIDAIARRIRDEPRILHFLRLAFADDGPRATAFNARGARFRSERLSLPFGDQGFGLSRALFERLGRFDERAPYGEDHLLVWAAHRAGVPVRVVDEPDATVTTSARRYRDRGWFRTTARHLAMTVAQATPQLAGLLADRFLRRSSLS